MSKSSATLHEGLQHSIAERYKNDGYEVTIEPKPSAIPFDLGGYAPDLIAKKGDLSLMIEIKAEPKNISFEQLRFIIDTVKLHPGWRFVLVTSQDLPSLDLPGEDEDHFSWDEVAQRIEDADRLMQIGQPEVAYLTLWIVFERMMRFQARRVALAIDRLTPSILIRQLYSQGELSMAQFDAALDCQVVRNRIVHGFPTPDFSGTVIRLRTVVRELMEQWSASGGDSR